MNGMVKSGFQILLVFEIQTSKQLLKTHFSWKIKDMLTNYLKINFSICLLVLLNACGIGHYHHLNLVRPDKKTTTALVKPKQKTKIVTETVKVDTAILETTEETVLTKTVNSISEKNETLAIAFLEKPSQHAKKTKIGLKEKLVQSFFKTKNDFLKNTQNNELNKRQTTSQPKDDGAIFLAILFFLLCFLIILTSLIVGITIISEYLVLGLCLIILPISFFLLYIYIMN